MFEKVIKTIRQFFYRTPPRSSDEEDLDYGLKEQGDYDIEGGRGPELIPELDPSYINMTRVTLFSRVVVPPLGGRYEFERTATGRDEEDLDYGLGNEHDDPIVPATSPRAVAESPHQIACPQVVIDINDPQSAEAIDGSSAPEGQVTQHAVGLSGLETTPEPTDASRLEPVAVYPEARNDSCTEVVSSYELLSKLVMTLSEIIQELPLLLWQMLPLITGMKGSVPSAPDYSVASGPPSVVDASTPSCGR